MTDKALTDEQILDLEMGENDLGAETVRHYLVELLAALWAEGEGFDPQQPSGWKWDLYAALSIAGLLEVVEGHGGVYFSHEERLKGDRIIGSAIRSLAADAWDADVLTVRERQTLRAIRYTGANLAEVTAFCGMMQWFIAEKQTTEMIPMVGEHDGRAFIYAYRPDDEDDGPFVGPRPLRAGQWIVLDADPGYPASLLDSEAFRAQYVAAR